MSYNDRGRHLIVWIQSTIVFGFMFGQCGVWRIWCLHLRRRTTFTTIPHSRPVNFSDDSVKLSTVNILFENLWIYRNLFLLVLLFLSSSTKFSLTYSLVYEEILTIEKWEKKCIPKNVWQILKLFTRSMVHILKNVEGSTIKNKERNYMSQHLIWRIISIQKMTLATLFLTVWIEVLQKLSFKILVETVRAQLVQIIQRSNFVYIYYYEFFTHLVYIHT